eukprot:g4174.t1
MASGRSLSLDDALLSLITKSSQLETVFRTRSLTIQLMRSFLARLSLEEAVAKMRVVHVAGSKGKGSTCALVESILRSHGLRTGLFTSPHLVDVSERFRVDGRPVPRALLEEHFWHVWDTLHRTHAAAVAATPEGSPPPPAVPNFFRFLTLVALRLFSAVGVDVVILEVGLGGRLDATNVVPHPIVCGISLLDLEHTHILGNTIELIAGEKAGIMKPGVPVVTVAQKPGALAVLRDKAAEVGAPLFQAEVWGASGGGGGGGGDSGDGSGGSGGSGGSWGYSDGGDDQDKTTTVAAGPPEVGLPGRFQLQNAGLAAALCRVFMASAGLAPPTAPQPIGAPAGALSAGSGADAADTAATPFTPPELPPWLAALGLAVCAPPAAPAGEGERAATSAATSAAAPAAVAAAPAAKKAKLLQPQGCSSEAGKSGGEEKSGSRGDSNNNGDHHHPLVPEKLRRGLADCRWPGRAQRYPLPGTGGRACLWLDGAHTGQSAAFCADWFWRSAVLQQESQEESQEEPQEAPQEEPQKQEQLEQGPEAATAINSSTDVVDSVTEAVKLALSLMDDEAVDEGTLKMKTAAGSGGSGDGSGGSGGSGGGVDVLVTGSLYLVGNVLKEAGWDPHGHQ